MGKINIPPRERSRELYAGQANLFEEAKHPRDEGGQFTSGGGPSATMSEEPFELERTKVKQTPRGEIPPKQRQQNLFNPSQQDLQGQQRLFGDKPEKATQTDTPEFKNWFGDSKVVDESGKPQVMYHGTMEEFTDTQQFDSDTNLGSHFGTLDVASRFARPGMEKGRLYPVFLSIKNPLRMQDKGSWSEFDIAKTFVSQGIMSEAEMEEWHEGFNARWKAHDWSKPYPRHKEAQALLDSRGFDGIDYVNRREVKLPDDLAFTTSKIDALTDDEFLARVPAAS